MKHILIITLTLLVTTFHAQVNVFWTVSNSVASSSYSNLRPRVAANASGDVVVLWGSMVAQANYVAVGNASGFSTPQAITPSGIGLFVDSWIGSEIAAHNNQIWASVFGMQGGQWSVFGIGSSNGGVTWGDTVRASPVGDEALYPTIDVGPTGPVIMYMEHDPGFSLPRYVSARSVNNGASFQSPVQISSLYAPGEVCDCCPANIQVEGNDVYALFRNNDHNQRDMYLGWSANGGASYSGASDVEPGSWTLFGCPSSGASSMVFGDSIRYVWMTGSSGASRVFMGTMHRTTKQIGHAAMVYADPNPSASQNFPVLAGTGDEFMIVWEYGTPGNKDVQYVVSTTGTAGTSTPQLAHAPDPGLQTNPDLTYGNGKYHLVWSDGSTGEVKYRAGTVPVKVATRAYLDGPFNGAGTMDDDLRVNGLIPFTEPYTALGYQHVGEGSNGTIAPSVLSTTGSNAIVDWVVLEARDKNDPTVVLNSRSVLIQRDGDVVDLDGISPVAMAVPSDDHYLAIRHRNHLGVMSANVLSLSSSATIAWDLTQPATSTHGSNALRSVNGHMTLWSGNVNGDGALRYTGLGNDRDPILVEVGGSVPTNTTTGYSRSDVNMDGTIRYTGLNNDRDPILVNVGGSVPTAVRDEQLP